MKDFATKSRHRLVGGSCLRFASAESSLASFVLSASSRCQKICSCCAHSGRHPKACQTAWFPSSRMLASRPSTSTCFPKEKPLASAEDLPGGTVTPTEFPGFRQQQQPQPTPSTPAADVFPSVDSVLETLISAVGNLASRLEALDTAPDELGGAPDAVLAEGSRWLEGSQGIRGRQPRNCPFFGKRRLKHASWRRTWRELWSRK